MIDLRVPSIGEAIANGQDSLILKERQLYPDLRDCLIASGVLALVMILSAVTLSMGGVFFVTFLIIFIGGALAVIDIRRLICIVAHPDYFLVMRSVRWRLGRHAQWDQGRTQGRLIAILENSGQLRPEERPAPETPGMREVHVFQNGRAAVLMSGRMTEDESLETLHRILTFFEKNVGAAAIESPAPAGPPSAPPPSRPRKGTLT